MVKVGKGEVWEPSRLVFYRKDSEIGGAVGGTQELTKLCWNEGKWDSVRAGNYV